MKNGYTIRISATNNRTGQVWGERNTTFRNEDNAISHIGVLDDFFDLLRENKRWGTTGSNDDLVERIIKPIKDRLEPPKRERGSHNP
jgi:hypothetical protein